MGQFSLTINNSQTILFRRDSKTTAELLQEDCQRFRRPQEQHRVDLWNVHTFVIDVNNKYEPELTLHQPILGCLPLLLPKSTFCAFRFLQSS